MDINEFLGLIDAATFSNDATKNNDAQKKIRDKFVHSYSEKTNSLVSLIKENF